MLTEKNSHEEHILQNAIAGKLKSKNILCEACGLELNNKVDKEFIKNFDIFASSLNLAKDRNRHKKPLVEAICLFDNDEEISVKIDNFKVKPVKPIYKINHEEKVVYVVAGNIKTARGFAKKQEIVIYTKQGYELDISDNLAPLLTKSVYYYSPNMNSIYLGLTKIALEFAIESGLEVEDFKHLINEKEKTINEARVVSYYPVQDYEQIYEVGKSVHEDQYPIHCLKLFTQENELICYIEIFSTFQFYVILSTDYVGKNVDLEFAQRCIQKSFNKELYTCGSHKDFHLVAGQLGVELIGNLDEIQHKIYETARKKTYEIELGNNARKAYDLYTLSALYKFGEMQQAEYINHEFVKPVIDKSNNASNMFGFDPLDDLLQKPATIINRMYKLETTIYDEFRVKNYQLMDENNFTETDLEDYLEYKVLELAAFSNPDVQLIVSVQTLI